MKHLQIKNEFKNMQEIKFETLSKRLKKLVNEEGLGLYGSLGADCWIEKIKNEKRLDDNCYCGEYYIKCFPPGQKPLYSILPDWLNVLLDGFERRSKAIIQDNIKKLLKIKD